jgi:DHA2 family multidrug resistance protein
MEKESIDKWIITITVMTGTIMSALDTSIVNVALPHMRGTLGTSVSEITWVAAAYMLSNVIIMPIIALLSSRFGRKSLYMFCVFLFTLSSIFCGMARSLGSMILFRIMQGVGGGALVPIAQSILRETWPVEQQGTAMGIYGLGVIMGPAIGPTLGGWITDNYSWPWIFYINIPIGIINLLLVSRYIKDPPYLIRERGKLDLAGLFFLIIGLGALQLMLEKGQEKDWFGSDFIVQLAILSSIGLILFIWRELATKKPAVDLRIFKNVTFASGTVLGGILGMGLFGSLFLLPIFLQELLDYPAYNSGLTLLPRSIAMAITMPFAGRLFNKVGPRFLIGIGLALSTISFLRLSSLSLDVGYWDLFLPQFAQGVGFGMVFVSLATAALIRIEKPKMQAATGLFNVVRQVCGSIGIAAAATYLDRGEQSYKALIVHNVTELNDVTQQRLNMLQSAMLNRGADHITAHERALKLLDNEVTRQATMLSFNHIFFLIASLFAVSIPLIFSLKSAKAQVKQKD